MSLVQSWESVYGVSLKEAYHRIISITFDYVENTKTTRIGIYCDKLSRDTGKPPIYIRKVVMGINEIQYPIRVTNYTELKTTTNYQEVRNI